MVSAYLFTYYENADRHLPKSGLLKGKIKFPTQDTNVKTYKPKYITDKCQKRPPWQEYSLFFQINAGNHKFSPRQ
jgi:hypothetical protein